MCENGYKTSPSRRDECQPAEKIENCLWMTMYSGITWCARCEEGFVTYFDEQKEKTYCKKLEHLEG